MKTIAFRIVSTLIVICIIGAVVFVLDPHPAPPVVPDVAATQADSVITAQMKRKIAKRDSLINALEIKLAATSETVTYQSVIIKRQKISVDTFSNYYRKHHNLADCDTLVKCQANYITGLEQLNDSLDSEAQQYSKLLYVERGKSADKDTLIGSKERLIVAYKQQFSRINCMDDWTTKHKFWSWLLGIKCK